MEYIFGPSTYKRKDTLVLKTKGSEHTDLSGPFSISLSYSDCTIHHSCNIIDHYHTAEDSEGNCYDWYRIDNYTHRIELAEIERDKLNEEIDALTNDCGMLVDKLYESDMEYIVGE